MAKQKSRIILTEFAVQVFTDGRIDWNGFDRYLWRRINAPEVMTPRAARRHPTK